MEPAVWIAIYLPIFILLFDTIPRQRHAALTAIKRRRKKEMNTELIQTYAGKYCTVSSGSFGSSVKGKILRVAENWIEIETRSGVQLVNADFVTLIRINDRS